MVKLKKDSAQKLLDGVCHLTGHRLFPQKDVCERCRRPLIYYAISLNNNYVKTEAQVLKTSKLIIELNVYQGDRVEITALSRRGTKYRKFHKKLKIRKPRRTLVFKF
jgi:hypothetical protein